MPSLHIESTDSLIYSFLDFSTGVNGSRAHFATGGMSNVK